ncbi:hypothetical protein JYU34_010536 [Plutella xylostella]|uniref:Uncharacterized protein n=1 Tax=Plutella xylostella TaxID=51655 RepID=A0ABQ7QIQ7_PLUXY|nr:hypothetical protein JYU34_010536 [Plutella xylostella]
MFSLLLKKFDGRPSSTAGSVEGSEDFSESDNEGSWKPPAVDPFPNIPSHDAFNASVELDFTSNVREADQLIAEPTPDIKREGIECQRTCRYRGSEGWSRTSQLALTNVKDWNELKECCRQLEYAKYRADSFAEPPRVSAETVVLGF